MFAGLDPDLRRKTKTKGNKNKRLKKINFNTKIGKARSKNNFQSGKRWRKAKGWRV
jgi:hypothetical protein